MTLYVDPRYPRFSRTDLVSEMRDRFGDFTDGTFRRWQERGLVAAPRTAHRWTEGRDGSTEGLWSDHDRQMLRALLRKRGELRRDVGGQFNFADLAPVVVWSWVYWDDVVAVEQARRALVTWSRPQVPGRQRSRTRVRENARQAVAAVASPDAPPRTREALTTKVTECLYTDDLAGLRRLGPDFAAVMDPSGTGRHIGALGLSVTAESEVQRLVWGHVGAQALAASGPHVADADLLAVRRRMRLGWVNYQGEWLSLRASTATPELFPPPDLTLQISRCATVFVALLGRRLDGFGETSPQGAGGLGIGLP